MGKNKSNTKKGLAQKRAKQQVITKERKQWERNLTDLNSKTPDFDAPSRMRGEEFDEEFPGDTDDL